MIEGERKLATIRRIANIEPIEGADRIVKATIDGWELVTQKENYKVGDLCVYFEIDSFLPVRPEFEFLRKGCFKSTTNLGDGFRIKTIKLKGQVSQGLSLPMKDFFEYDPRDCNWYYMKDVLLEPSAMPDKEAQYLKEGDDLTEYFGVQKYEKPLPKQGGANFGQQRGNFPSFIPKTDQERIQNCLAGIKNWIFYDKPEVTEVTREEIIDGLNAGVLENTENLHFFKSGEQWFCRTRVPATREAIAERMKFEATMKLDGSSMTVYHNDGQIGVCSRNFDLKRDTESVFWRAAINTRILSQLVQVGMNVAVQGELMGPGVQGNREKLTDHKFFIFDVYLIDEKRHMTPTERDEFMGKITNDDHCFFFDHVPVVNPSMEIEESFTVADFLLHAERKSINHEIAEGVVYKSHVPGGPTFKCISNKFLLAEKD